jgi:hypothetical protein
LQCAVAAGLKHYLLHQFVNHLLADDPILLAREFCDRLRDRIYDFICFIGGVRSAISGIRR